MVVKTEIADDYDEFVDDGKNYTILLYSFIVNLKSGRVGHWTVSYTVTQIIVILIVGYSYSDS